VVTAAELKKLREPFKPEQIGKLPKPTKKDNPRGKCDFCGGFHGLPAIHLDYVGHAAVTDRLLSVDPDYEFGPVFDATGLPVIRGAEMLHSLTVCGATRFEWGEGPNMKEISSDAIRRCAMRFGVALDLWAKETLPGSVDEVAAPRPESPSAGRRSSSKPKGTAWADKTQAQRDLLKTAQDLKIDEDLRHRLIRRITEGATQSTEDLSDDACRKTQAQLKVFAAYREAGMKNLEEWETAQ
jgi:hypothetical protein